MNQNELKAYACTFVSYLVRELELSSINRIILYGSVARGEATAQSDVDIFLDTSSPTLSKSVKEIVEEFYNSREATIFRLKKIENRLSLKVGELKKWKELHHSIANSGITLWGRYETSTLPVGSKQMLLVSWENIGKNRGAFLNRIYGFNSKGKHYPGLLERFKGEKIGKSSIIIPFSQREEFLMLLKDYSVKARQKVVFVSE
ncbi:MAG: nucleotidyltransferase domain-containing protein [Nanoarchaeota archaeon]